eukprot:Nk52_evm108s485 gene=Nk52_evmTU108s485
MMLFKSSSMLNIALLLIFAFFFLADARPTRYSDTVQKHELLRRSSSPSDSLSEKDVWASIESGFVADNVEVNCQFHSDYTEELHGYSSYLCNRNVCASYTPSVQKHYFDEVNDKRVYYYTQAIIGPYCWFDCTTDSVSLEDVDLVSLLNNGTVSENYTELITCSGTVIGTSKDNLEIKLA